ncbi:hypothetical protein DL98DRAFT_599713 [Cadophora sp. DSE1049]|nr:hypothetical protein DL98DRAFT_599713 [Cadophora sp. DSE1049]
MASNNTNAHPAGFLPAGIIIQSQHLRINEWLNQMTLCLARLAAHVLIGVPTLVNRTGQPISWYEMIPLFNPITILWRYAIIALRRIRFIGKWSAEAMAATNAAFFYAKGWSSSEAKIDQPPAWRPRSPPSTRTAIFSISMLGSLIVVVQGSRYRGVFTPLAIVSLFRLIPATWITQDFAFRDARDYEEDPDIPPFPIHATAQEQRGDAPPQPIQMQVLSRRVKVDGNGRDGNSSKSMPVPSLSCKSRVYWASMLFRFAILAICGTIFVNQCFHISGHHTFGGTQSVSGLSIHFMYHIMTTVMLVLFALYFLRGKVQDTHDPMRQLKVVPDIYRHMVCVGCYRGRCQRSGNEADKLRSLHDVLSFIGAGRGAVPLLFIDALNAATVQ